MTNDEKNWENDRSDVVNGLCARRLGSFLLIVSTPYQLLDAENKMDPFVVERHRREIIRSRRTKHDSQASTTVNSLHTYPVVFLEESLLSLQVLSVNSISGPVVRCDR